MHTNKWLNHNSSIVLQSVTKTHETFKKNNFITP